MACGESRSRVIFLCLELFLFATLLCHSARLPEPAEQLPEAPQVVGELKKRWNISQSQTETMHRHHGKLLIGENSVQEVEPNETKATEDFMEADYQADMGWEEQTVRLNVKPDMAAVERLLKMQPKVECTVNSMKLQVQDVASAPETLFFVDRGSRLSPLPLSKLPPSCGYTIRSIQRGLVLVAPYDGCFVALEDDGYVLPMRWWGIPVRMTCPLLRHAASKPAMVTCHADGMMVKTEWNILPSRIQVNLNGNWEPILKASQRCLFSIVEHPEGVVISLSYAPCLKEMNGFYTLDLAGDGEMKITCPALPSPPPEYPQKDKSLPSPPVSFSAPKKSPPTETPSAHHSPGFSQSSEISNKKPGVDRDPSQMAYYLLHPSFLRAHPPSPESPHTAQSVKAISPPSPVVHSKDQRWQTQDHVPFHSQPPPSPPSTIQLSAGQLNQGLQLKPFLRPPFLLRKHVEQPGNQKKRVSYQFISYYHEPGFETHHVESSSHPSPSHAEKGPEKPKPPHGQGASGVQQPEPPRVQTHQHDHSDFHPRPGLQTANNHPVSQSPQPDAQQSQKNHRFYNYPIPTHPDPVDQLRKRPDAVPEPQAPQLQKPQFHPEAEPEIQPFGQAKVIYQPLELDFPQNQEHQPNPHPKPEIHSSENPAAGSLPHLAEILQEQVHQPMNLYPHLDLNSQPPGHPHPATDILGKDHSECEKFNMPTIRKSNVSADATLQSAHPPNNKPPQIQTQNPFTFFYDSQKPQYFQPRIFPPGVTVSQQVTSSTEPQTPTDAAIPQNSHDTTVSENPNLSPPLMPLLNCPPMCLPEFPNCCPKMNFHQHIHHVVPVGHGSSNAPLFYLGQPFLPSSAYPGDGLSYDGTPQKPETVPSLTTPSPGLDSGQSLPSVNEEQAYLQPQDGNPFATHETNPRKAANLNEPVSYFTSDSQYSLWPNMQHNEDQHDLAKSQSPAHRNSRLSTGNTEGPSIPIFMPFIGQYSQEHQHKPTVTEHSFEKDPSEYEGFMQYENSRELDRLLVPSRTTQDTPFPFPNDSQLRMFIRGSNNLTKHEPHSDVYPTPQNLTKYSSSRVRNPENLIYLLSKQPNWLEEEMPNPAPGNIFMQRINVDSTSPLSALNGPHGLFLPPDTSTDATRLKANFPETLHWKSLTPLGPGPNLPPHVPGKMFRWGSTAGQQAHVLSRPLQMERTEKKRR